MSEPLAPKSAGLVKQVDTLTVAQRQAQVSDQSYRDELERPTLRNSVTTETSAATSTSFVHIGSVMSMNVPSGCEIRVRARVNVKMTIIDPVLVGGMRNWRLVLVRSDDTSTVLDLGRCSAPTDFVGNNYYDTVTLEATDRPPAGKTARYMVMVAMSNAGRAELRVSEQYWEATPRKAKTGAAGVLDVLGGAATISGVPNTSAGTVAAALAAFTGTTNIVTLGAITTGTWTATQIANAYIATGLDITKCTVGATLPSQVLASSLTSVGTLSSLVMGGAITGATGLTLASGQILAPAGTTAAPSWSFSTDPDTGFYTTTANQIFVSLGNALHNRFTTVGLMMHVAGSSRIIDGNANPFLAFTSAASAVNYLTLANSATGNAISLSATGSDATISIAAQAKGASGDFLVKTDFSATNFIYNRPNQSAAGEIPAGSAIAGNHSLSIRSSAAGTTGETLSATYYNGAAHYAAWEVINVASGFANLNLMKAGGNVTIGRGSTAPTARLHLPAGVAAASGAPLKFTSGVSLTTAEAGAVEFTTDDYFATITTGAARKAFVLDDGARLTSGKIPRASTNGRLIDGPTPLSGAKVYYVSDSSGGAVTRKLTFTDGILTAET